MKFFIATGGTGGHIFPALAVANELLKRGHRVTVSTDTRGMNTISKNFRGTRVFVWASGVGGRGKLNALFSLFKIGLSAIALLLRFIVFRPTRVVAFGGYASVPAVLAANILKIPTFLHEQNGAIGRANKFALKFVKTLMISFPNVSGIPQNVENVVYTGLPVRDDFVPMPYEFNYNILITGGSLGAQVLDEVVPNAIFSLPNSMKKKLFVVHQTRPSNVEKLENLYSENKIRANVLSFINDMPKQITNASLIVGRSGASTVAEIQTIGRPAIFVPLTINPDQAANASIFEKSGGGFAVSQNKFTPKWLGATIGELFENPKRLEKMANKARTPNNAVNNIIEVVE